MSFDRAIPIPEKPNSGDPIRAATLGDIIEGVDRLAHRAQIPVLYRKDPARKPSSAATGRAEFRVFRGSVPNRLNIEPGSIVRLLFGADAVRIELPEFPTIGSLPCNELQGDNGEDGYPSFHLTGFTAGEDYFVAAVITRSASWLVVGLAADPDLIPAPGKLVRRIARVQFEANDDELLEISEIEQLWIGSMEVRFHEAPPFHCELITDTSGETPVYKIAVHPGRVCERIPGVSDAISNHVPTNLVDGSGLPILHTVEVGKQVGVVVRVLDTGEIGAESPAVPVTIEVDDAGRDSTHYVPKCGDDQEGSPGVYRYELARLVAGTGDDASPILQIALAGSHIDHFQDITQLDNTANPSAVGMGRIVKEWNNDAKRYLFRGLIQGYDEQVRLIENENDITVRGNGKNGALIINNCNGEEAARIDWLDGLITTEGTLTIQAGCPSSETPP